jgi:hypothetical protein
MANNESMVSLQMGSMNGRNSPISSTLPQQDEVRQLKSKIASLREELRH